MPRAMRPDEAPLAASIHREAFPGGGWSEAFFLAASGDPTRLLLVEGEPVAGLVLVGLAGLEAEILTIASSRRREGAGGRLLRAAIAEAAARGAESLFLEVSTANKAALALYARFGFTEVGLRRRYYANGEDAAVLRRPLRKGDHHGPS
jgi:ribosomal-protein-alanine N-acetyltransferase